MFKNKGSKTQCCQCTINNTCLVSVTGQCHFHCSRIPFHSMQYIAEYLIYLFLYIFSSCMVYSCTHTNLDFNPFLMRPATNNNQLKHGTSTLQFTTIERTKNRCNHHLTLFSKAFFKMAVGKSRWQLACDKLIQL